MKLKSVCMVLITTSDKKREKQGKWCNESCGRSINRPTQEMTCVFKDCCFCESNLTATDFGRLPFKLSFLSNCNSYNNAHTVQGARMDVTPCVF